MADEEQNTQHRGYVFCTVELGELKFDDHDFNPRTPSAGKVQELKASIRHLTLLNPLVCAYVGHLSQVKRKDDVVLIDGRHRYRALQELVTEHDAWLQTRVDLKIYYDLKPSDLHVLATYLNRTRRALRKGEYYTAVVKIFETKRKELEEESRGKPQTEEEIFKAVSPKELAHRDFDLSVGRVVGLTAFNEEEAGKWFPFVGNRQHERYYYEDPDTGQQESGVCPITAGNLAELLRNLCRPRPYPDYGEKRAVEITNVLRFGETFRRFILRPVDSYREATMTTVACRHWCVSALGQLLGESTVFGELPDESSPFSQEAIDWTALDKTVEIYGKLMQAQADIVNEAKALEDPIDRARRLRDAWSHQTVGGRVADSLRAAFRREGIDYFD